MAEQEKIQRYSIKDFEKPLTFDESRNLLKYISKKEKSLKIIYSIPVIYILSNGNVEVSRKKFLEGLIEDENTKIKFEFCRNNLEGNKDNLQFTHIELLDTETTEKEDLYLRNLAFCMNKVITSIDNFFEK